jgi:nicotinamide-nucleotide amidase
VIPANIREAAQRIIDDFAARELTVVTAESCTGGLVGGALTEIAGSSAVVLCGFITYSNEAKHRMLGVPLDTLKQFGAVSQQTALAMAQGALSNSDATISVSITGIAGPGGGSADKPVGLVHFGAAKRGGREITREMRFGDIGRSMVRERAVLVALEMLAEVAA